MTTPHNPYVTPASLRVSALLDEYVDPMEEESPNSSKDTQESQKEGSTQGSQEQASPTDKEIEVKEEDKPLPLSFHHTLMEETLWDDNHPYIFWATIRIPIPEDPINLVSMMFEHLETFMTNMLEVDAHSSCSHTISANTNQWKIYPNCWKTWTTFLERSMSGWSTSLEQGLAPVAAIRTPQLYLASKSHSQK